MYIFYNLYRHDCDIKKSKEVKYMSENLKHQQIELFIRHGIEKGEFNIGDQIPTEADLCKQFGFSRMTVNKALTHLCETGYITRIPGKGSFVSAPHVRKPLSRASSFTEDMAKIGLVAGSELISYELIKAEKKPNIAAKLNLSGDDFMHYFVRLRTGDNKPIAISYTYISAKVVPAIDVASLNKSLYAYLLSIGIKAEVSKFELRATLPTEKQKKLLKMNDCALLCSQHVSYTKCDGLVIPFEYIETYYNGDMYTYTVEI